MKLRSAQRFISSNSGAIAVEFAMVLPALAMLVVGTLSAGLVMYSVSGLQSAVEAGARCYSVNSTLCSTASDTQSYAESHYYGVSTPTFTASLAACGHQVSATVNVDFNAGIKSWDIPLRGAACYP
jgi:Flp pilus assembly protein TadG